MEKVLIREGTQLEPKGKPDCIRLCRKVSEILYSKAFGLDWYSWDGHNHEWKLQVSIVEHEGLFLENSDSVSQTLFCYLQMSPEDSQTISQGSSC